MKKSLSKLAISMGTVATVALPIAIATSCTPLLGAIGRYDSEDDGVVVIQTTWSAGGKPIAALEKQVSNYNKTMNSTPGYLPVKIEHVEGGYGTVPSQILTKIQSQDTKTLPNLYIDYASAVGMIAPYKMVFDAKTPTLRRGLFEESFVNINDKIAGVPSGGLYSVPLARSTEALVYDKPLLKYLLTEVNNKFSGAVKKNAANPIIKGIMDFALTSDDKNEIRSGWGTIKPNSKISEHYEITDDIFHDFTSLRKFLMEIQPLFTNGAGGNLLGIDSPSNFTYLLSSLLSKNVDKDFLMSKNNKTDFIDFSFLEDGSKQASIFRKVYKDYIYDPLTVGGLWVGGGGAFGSTRLSKHLMAISIGSSAGLSHSVDRDSKFLNKNEVGFVSPPEHIYSAKNKPQGDTYAWDKVTASISQGPSFNTVHINDHEDASTKKFLEWFFTHKDDDHPTVQITDTFSSSSEYIVPMKGAFDDNSQIGKIVGSKTYSQVGQYKWGLKMGFETVKRQIANNKLSPSLNVVSKIFEPPVDDSTGAVRKVIDSKIKASSNSKNSGGSPYAAATLWNKIHMQAIIDNVITGKINRTKYNYPNQMNRNFSNIEWQRYQYVDAIITSWTDGDTPNVSVTSVHALSDTSPVKAIKIGDQLAIRISGIDTPEAHVKLGEVKRKTLVKGVQSAEGLSDDYMKQIIDKYRNLGTPLATFSKGHYNELHYKKELDGMNAAQKATFKAAHGEISRYNDWKAIYVDIQTKDDSTEAGKLISYDGVLKDPSHPNSFYELRRAKLGNDKLITDLAIAEGVWGLKAGELGRKLMPAGTRIRVATDGNKSYNRVVGSIFFGDYLEKNWSVEIAKTGLTMPFIGDVAAVAEPANILWENGQAIADAFNSAISGKKGLFNYSSGTLDEHLKWLLATHGATEYGNLLHGTPGSIYEYMKYRNPVREPIATKGGH